MPQGIRRHRVNTVHILFGGVEDHCLAFACAVPIGHREEFSAVYHCRNAKIHDILEIIYAYHTPDVRADRASRDL